MVKAPVDTDFYSEWARGWIEQAANTGTEMTLAGFTVTKTFPKRGRTLWGPVRFWDGKNQLFRFLIISLVIFKLQEHIIHQNEAEDILI